MRIWLTALFLSLSLTGLGLAQTCAQKCDPDQGQQRLKSFVVLDANSCKKEAGKTSFPMNTEIQLSLVHQNPYAFTYRYDIEEREVEAAFLSGALSQLLLLPSDSASEAAAQTSTDGVNRMAAILSANAVHEEADLCPSMDSYFNDKDTRTQHLSQQIITKDAAVRSLLNGKKADLAAYNAFVKNRLPMLPTTETQCGQLCDAGEKVLPKLNSLLSLKSVNNAMTELDRAIDDLVKHRQDVISGASGEMGSLTQTEKTACEQRRDKAAQEIQKKLKIFKTSRNVLAADIKALKDNENKIKALRDIVKSVNDAPNAFVYLDYLEARDIPVEFDVKITRKNRTTQAETSCTRTIRAGRNRFSMSAGIGMSFIEQQTFGRQQALVPTTMMQDDGTTTEGTGIGEIFAVTDTSSESVVGVFQLNGRIGSLGKGSNSWGWALGATVGEGEGEASSFGYFTGPTFSLISDQLFFTLAYHQREVDELGGNFAVGEPVPTGFMGELPITTETQSGLLFTVTYRFR